MKAICICCRHRLRRLRQQQAPPPLGSHPPTCLSGCRGCPAARRPAGRRRSGGRSGQRSRRSSGAFSLPTAHRWPWLSVSLMPPRACSTACNESSQHRTLGLSCVAVRGCENACNTFCSLASPSLFLCSPSTNVHSSPFRRLPHFFPLCRLCKFPISPYSASPPALSLLLMRHCSPFCRPPARLSAVLQQEVPLTFHLSIFT